MRLDSLLGGPGSVTDRVVSRATTAVIAVRTLVNRPPCDFLAVKELN